jgi:hypothetical protein
MIIFGWGGGTPKKKGDVAPVQCPNCERSVFFQHVSSTKWFRLYLIPLIPYDTKNFLLCPVCTRGAELTSSQLRSVETMKALTAQWRAQNIGDDAYSFEVQSFWPDLFGVSPATRPPTTNMPPPPPTGAKSPGAWESGRPF